MLQTVTCKKCGSLLQYNDKSVWEGLRDHEDVNCPVCNNIVDTVFTDGIVCVKLLRRGYKDEK